MILDEKFIDNKVLDLDILYNFNIKFDFIRAHMKSYEYFYMEPFVGAGHAIIRL